MTNNHWMTHLLKDLISFAELSGMPRSQSALLSALELVVKETRELDRIKAELGDPVSKKMGNIVIELTEQERFGSDHVGKAN